MPYSEKVIDEIMKDNKQGLEQKEFLSLFFMSADIAFKKGIIKFSDSAFDLKNQVLQKKEITLKRVMVQEFSLRWLMHIQYDQYPNLNRPYVIGIFYFIYFILFLFILFYFYLFYFHFFKFFIFYFLYFYFFFILFYSFFLFFIFFSDKLAESILSLSSKATSKNESLVSGLFRRNIPASDLLYFEKILKETGQIDTVIEEFNGDPLGNHLFYFISYFIFYFLFLFFIFYFLIFFIFYFHFYYFLIVPSIIYKRLFMMLTEPLFPNYDLLVEIATQTSTEENYMKIWNSLPILNRNVLLQVTDLVMKCADPQFVQLTKMNLSNLSVCLTPGMMRSDKTDTLTLLTQQNNLQSLWCDLIEHIHKNKELYKEEKYVFDSSQKPNKVSQVPLVSLQSKLNITLNQTELSEEQEKIKKSIDFINEKDLKNDNSEPISLKESSSSTNDKNSKNFNSRLLKQTSEMGKFANFLQLMSAQKQKVKFMLGRDPTQEESEFLEGKIELKFSLLNEHFEQLCNLLVEKGRGVKNFFVVETPLEDTKIGLILYRGKYPLNIIRNIHVLASIFKFLVINSQEELLSDSIHQHIKGSASECKDNITKFVLEQSNITQMICLNDVLHVFSSLTSKDLPASMIATIFAKHVICGDSDEQQKINSLQYLIENYKLIFQSSVEIPKDQQNEFLSHQQNGTEENKTKHLSLQNRSTTDDKVIVNNSLITSSSHPTILISPRNKQATQNNKKEENTIEYTTTKISENTETKTEQISSKIIRTSNPEINSPNTLSPRENETANS